MINRRLVLPIIATFSGSFRGYWNRGRSDLCQGNMAALGQGLIQAAIEGEEKGRAI